MTDRSKYLSLSKIDYEAFAGPDWPSYEQFTLHENVPEFVYNELEEFLSNYKKFDDPAFCVLPFYGIEYPTNVNCCIMQPADINQVKQSMLNGVRHKACTACWQLEDAGLLSDRIIKNNSLDHFSRKDLNFLYEDAKKNSTSILSYKIDSSTVCNATCVTCSSRLSSSWAQLERKNNVVPIQHSESLSESQVSALIDFPSAKMINFRGGEPLLHKTNFFILEQLIAHNNTDCFISFTTNGSIIPTEAQYELLSKFKNLDFDISIDGTESVFEYMRYPLKWRYILDIVEWCKERNINISASYTISNLNIHYYKQTTQWFSNNKINYINNVVKQPSYFSPDALPKYAKDKILLQDPDLAVFFRQHLPLDDVNFKRAQVEVAKQDRWKNISINDFLPDLKGLLT